MGNHHPADRLNADLSAFVENLIYDMKLAVDVVSVVIDDDLLDSLGVDNGWQPSTKLLNACYGSLKGLRAAVTALHDGLHERVVNPGLRGTP